MIQRGDRLRFALEALATLGIVRDGGRQHFDRDLAMELGVARTKHLTHPTDADAGTDFIRAEARAGGQGQR